MNALMHIVLILILSFSQHSSVFPSPVTTVIKRLPDVEIDRLIKLVTKPKGTELVGKELQKYNSKVIEDAYLRIATRQGKIGKQEADQLYNHLSGVTGFSTTLRKITGNSQAVTIGHLNEIRIAHFASRSKFEVVEIGQSFSDPAKKQPTDIDILIRKDNKTFAIEAKDYTDFQYFTMDKYRADLDTLITYKNTQSVSVIPVFTFTRKPENQDKLKMIIYEAEKRNVELIVGNAYEQIEQIKLLVKIL